MPSTLFISNTILDYVSDTIWLVFGDSQIKRTSNWIFQSHMCICHAFILLCTTHLLSKTEQDSGIKLMRDSKMSKKRYCSQRVSVLRVWWGTSPHQWWTKRGKFFWCVSLVFPLASFRTLCPYSPTLLHPAIFQAPRTSGLIRALPYVPQTERDYSSALSMTVPLLITSALLFP